MVSDNKAAPTGVNRSKGLIKDLLMCSNIAAEACSRQLLGTRKDERKGNDERFFLPVQSLLMVKKINIETTSLSVLLEHVMILFLETSI